MIQKKHIISILLMGYLIINLFPFIINVKCATKTFSYNPTTNIITMNGGNSTDPINYNDVYNADKSMDYIIDSRYISSTDNNPVVLDNTLRPADYVELGGNSTDLLNPDSSYDDLIISFIIWDVGITSIKIVINGTNRDGTYISEFKTFTTSGNQTTTLSYHTLETTKCSVGGSPIIAGCKYEIIQKQLGVVWKISDTQFRFDCKTYLDSGYFEDYGKEIIYTSSVITSTSDKFFDIDNYAYCTLGVLEDATEKKTSQGITFIAENISISHWILHVRTLCEEFNLYSASIQNTGTALTRVQTYQVNTKQSRVWNCLFSNNIRTIVNNYCDIYNLILQKATGTIPAIDAQSDDVLIERIYVSDYYSISYFYSNINFTLTDIYARGCTYGIYSDSTWSGNAYFINCNLDNWGCNWIGSPTGEAYRQYTFNAQFLLNENTYAENATVTISNTYLDYSANWTLSSNGSIPEQIYSYGHYNDTGGNTIYDYNPYTLTVELDGYATYETSFNITEETDLVITLQDLEDVWDIGLIALSVCLGFGAIFMVVIIDKREKRR